MALGLTDTSRLGCQVLLSKAEEVFLISYEHKRNNTLFLRLQGMKIKIPDEVMNMDA